MTIGIYKINFNNTNKVYIGQSVDITSRLHAHLSKLRLGKAPSKLQHAYNTYGISGIEVILECSIDELNTTEKEAIEIYDSFNNGFNSIPDASVPILYGEDSGNALESNVTYLLILTLLVQTNPTLTKREIHELTGVSLYTIRHIAALESHIWLKEADPINYAKLEYIKSNKPYNYGKQYPRILSPEGVEYDVTHVTNFAREHGMLQPKLTELLKGTRRTHKGWTLAQS